MISGCRSDYQDDIQGINHRDQLDSEVVGASSSGGARGSESQVRSFLSSLSILKQKVNQVQSYANILAPQPNFHVNQQLITSDDESTSSIALATMGTIIQEIIFTSSSMMFNCQQMSLYYPNEGNHQHHHVDHMASFSHLDGVENNVKNTSQAYVDEEGSFEWYANNYTSTTTTATTTTALAAERKPISKNISKQVVESLSQEIYDIVELNVTDLLAKYTHYCQVCGKGFKRDANLRMHMRAHGDEYKSSAALSNPMKKINGETSSSSAINVPRKFSCPHEGCRWNKKHAKFQPLKSIICVKNHYKRSHCPKMYVCKRCNRKQFSVLSDLRTHEKHCGDVKWQCSCGTTFSRKDKLMGHVTLFVGHNPLVNHHLGSMDNKLDTQRATQIQF